VVPPLLIIGPTSLIPSFYTPSLELIRGLRGRPIRPNPFYGEKNTKVYGTTYGNEDALNGLKGFSYNLEPIPAALSIYHSVLSAMAIGNN